MLRLVVLLNLAALLGCAGKFSSPPVQRGEPIQFSVEEVDPSMWTEKTNPQNKNLWFKFSDDGKGWWIDWDAGRLPFNLIVIHHSAGPSFLAVAEIEADHVARLYGGRYKGPYDDPYVVGLTPHSGHVVNGRETFIAYHHLVYPDGRMLTTLSPLVKINGMWYVDHVGWHAGNWNANCRSIAICLLGDYDHQVPPKKQLEAVRKLILYYRGFSPNLTVEPHKKFNPTKSCPGNTWDEWAPKIQ